jgi:hypothetical protein
MHVHCMQPSSTPNLHCTPMRQAWVHCTWHATQWQLITLPFFNLQVHTTLLPSPCLGCCWCLAVTSMVR